jgi:broad specificity phosphatase PhoE
MSEIYLFRHGQASFGTEHYDRLSPTGRRQSEVLAAFLEAGDIHFDAVYSGRMHRHAETAQPFCGRYAGRRPPLSRPEKMAAFDEYDTDALLAARKRLDAAEKEAAVRLSELRQDKKAFQVYFADTVVRWSAGEFDAQKGVEPYPLFCRRVQNGLSRIMERHGSRQRIAVFTSGGPISAAVKNAIMLNNEKTVEISWQIMNASLTCLKYSAGKMALSVFNNVSHLWLERDPALITYR